MINTFKKNSSLSWLLAVGSVAALIVMLSAQVANANPSYFQRQNNGITDTATTSVNYMTPGTATSTYYFDAGQGTAGSVDSAVLLTQLTASTTSSTINIAYEYAQGGNGDCIATPTICDWYQNDLLSATSTSLNLTSQISATWTFASTTQGQAGIIPAANSNRQLKSFVVLTPTRYIRAIVSVPVGSTNAGVWAEFVAKKQAAN